MTREAPTEPGPGGPAVEESVDTDQAGKVQRGCSSEEAQCGQRPASSRAREPAGAVSENRTCPSFPKDVSLVTSRWWLEISLRGVLTPQTRADAANRDLLFWGFVLRVVSAAHRCLEEEEGTPTAAGEGGRSWCDLRGQEPAWRFLCWVPALLSSGTGLLYGFHQILKGVPSHRRFRLLLAALVAPRGAARTWAPAPSPLHPPGAGRRPAGSRPLPEPLWLSSAPRLAGAPCVSALRTFQLNFARAELKVTSRQF